MWNISATNNLSKAAMDNLCFPVKDPQLSSSAMMNFNKNGAHVMCDEEMSFFNGDLSGQQEEEDLFDMESGKSLLLSEDSSVRYSIFDTKAESNHQMLSKASNSSKEFRVFNSLSSESMELSMDEEYMDMFDMETMEDQKSQTNTLFNDELESFKLPSNLHSLFSGKIQNVDNQDASHSSNQKSFKTPELRHSSVRRCLSMTENHSKIIKEKKLCEQGLQSEPKSPMAFSSQKSNIHMNNCFKRPDPPSLTCSPVQSKRYRFQEKENINYSASEQNLPNCRSTHQTLRKCMSMNDAEIMSALDRSDNKDQPDLIGDFSGPFALPLIEGRHRDLKSISSHTMARLLNGEFDDKVASFKIIDCRYPYEFEGGHIRGAKNLYTQEQIIKDFLSPEKSDVNNMKDKDNEKRHIIIFHCEFSSERGPKLSRFLRNNDRARNTSLYPALDYPEIYLLHNGYKEFFETHAEFCDPMAYRPMLEPAYNEAYRHFRAKSKSWNGDGLGGGSTRLKKSRSRLLL